MTSHKTLWEGKKTVLRQWKRFNIIQNRFGYSYQSLSTHINNKFYEKILGENKKAKKMTTLNLMRSRCMARYVHGIQKTTQD